MTGLNRLDRMVARLLTQRACILEAARLLRGADGPILEIGLGKGRTYTHLRQHFPDNEIYAFDRDVHAPADSVPDSGHLFLGDFKETLPAAARRLGRTAVLVHADIGTDELEGDGRRDADLARFIGGQLSGLVAPGGLVLSDREMPCDDLRALTLPAVPLPEGLPPWPYHFYRLGGGAS